MGGRITFHTSRIESKNATIWFPSYANAVSYQFSTLRFVMENS
jgi:hypothetical protein